MCHFQIYYSPYYVVVREQDLHLNVPWSVVFRVGKVPRSPNFAQGPKFDLKFGKEIEKEYESNRQACILEPVHTKNIW